MIIVSNSFIRLMLSISSFAITLEHPFMIIAIFPHLRFIIRRAPAFSNCDTISVICLDSEYGTRYDDASVDSPRSGAGGEIQTASMLRLEVKATAP